MYSSGVGLLLGSVGGYMVKKMIESFIIKILLCLHFWVSAVHILINRYCIKDRPYPAFTLH
ncbi:small, acid-soluble spore protein, alpha/beta type [Mediterraneibacter gnavus]|uniref:small, acid-soluble spore protein, alpha/beta type n=1 Tax=Mediterraneibacter gnavus TaxID=33038 RepID=UPI000DEEA243